jgi:hypothetical protein
MEQVGGAFHWNPPTRLAYHDVPFNILEHDVMGGWDPVNYRWTPKVPGYYSLHFTGTLYLYVTNPTGANTYITLARNGVQASCVQWATPALAGSGNHSWNASMSALEYFDGKSDYTSVRLYTEQPNATEMLMLCQQAYQFPRFMAHKITY